MWIRPNQIQMETNFTTKWLWCLRIFGQCIADGPELDIFCAFEKVLSSAKGEFGGACGIFFFFYLSLEWWGGVQL